MEAAKDAGKEEHPRQRRETADEVGASGQRTTPHHANGHGHEHEDDRDVGEGHNGGHPYCGARPNGGAFMHSPNRSIASVRKAATERLDGSSHVPPTHSSVE